MSRKSFYLLILCISFANSIFAQLERDSVTVIMDLQELFEVKIADLDNDDDQDIIGSRTGWDGHLAFLENTDGLGTLAWPVVTGDSSWAGTSAAYKFELADMDNDGDLDVVDGRVLKSTIPYWINNGLGEFSLPTQNENDDYLIRDYDEFRLADMNNDGWVDIVYYHHSNRKIYINWNNGAGQAFNYEMILSLNFLSFHELHDFELEDYDQDGDLDIFIFSTFQDEGQEPWKEMGFELIKQEAGIFTLENEIGLWVDDNLHLELDASLSDLDADGYPDVIMTLSPPGNFDNDLWLVRNLNGSGSFQTQEQLPKYQYHTLMDVDQDGDQDIITIKDAKPFPSYPTDIFAYEWLENNGTFDLTPHAIDSSYTGFKLLTGDINSDGVDDLISYTLENSSLILTLDDSQLFVRPADNNGNFLSPAPLTNAFSYIRDLATPDWNMDGQLDILMATEGGISWIENLSSGTSYANPINIWNAPAAIGNFKFVNIKQDDLIDGIGMLKTDEGWPNSYYPFIWVNNATGGTNDIYEFQDIFLRNIYNIATGKLDSDTDNDIVLITSTSEVIIIWNELNTSDEFTIETSSLTAPGTPNDIQQIYIEDINLDGFSDLVVLLSDEGIYYSPHLDGEGTFDDWTSIAGTEDFQHIFIDDYNLDGLTDIRARVSTGDGFELAMLAYDTANQNFTAPIRLSSVTNHFFVEELDLNDDNIPDLLSGEGYALSLGTSGHITAPYRPLPFYVQLFSDLAFNPLRADLNGDGEKELVTGLRGIMSYDLDFLNGSSVQGLMLWDTTGNCTFDSLYPVLPDGQLTLNSGISEQISSTTQSTGHYSFYLPDAPQHILTPVSMSEYWTICPEDSTLSNDGPHLVHFSASANVDCPLMELDLYVGSVPQCFPSTISMAYRNIGTIPASPVTITITFDDRMTPVSSTPVWSGISDTSLTFILPNVAVGEEGQIVIEMEPDCENLVLGETLCFEANITPDTLCDPMLAQWDGANLQAAYDCESDSITFTITNTGNGNMASPQTYQLNIVNDDIVLSEVGDVQLQSGAMATITAPATEDGYLLIVEQPNGHPNPETILLLSEGCLTPLDTSLLNTFPNDNGDGFSVERCSPVVGPYDPNIKVAIPEGYGEQHFIAADQAIQYTIHFQNVGTDKARTVVIRDLLSDQLDLATFQPGPASHTHEWIILPDRTLTITFPEINLPDSTSNEAESHGFFSYTIKPIEGILPYNSIENEAAIYFDFNPPIITNRTSHLIEKPQIGSVLHATLCPGNEYLGIPIYQDTLIKEIYEMPNLDSIVWHHINVLSTEDTTQVYISLDESGTWQGIDIHQDTIIIETLESSMGCDSIVSYWLSILTDTENPYWAQNIQLSPNPTHDQVQLSWQYLPGNHNRIRIYQSLGQLAEEHLIPANSNSYQWEIHNWPSGIYWIELNADGQIARWRLVVN